MIFFVSFRSNCFALCFIGVVNLFCCVSRAANFCSTKSGFMKMYGFSFFNFFFDSYFANFQKIVAHGKTGYYIVCLHVYLVSIFRALSSTAFQNFNSEIV